MSESDPPLNTVLAATDFSRAGTHAVERAALLAHRQGAALHILHVLPQPPMGEALQALTEFFRHRSLAFDQAQARIEALGRLDALRQRLSQTSGLRVSTHLAEGRPAPAIAEQAQALAAGLVVVGSHGERGLRELFVGSTSQKLLRIAPCPVLLVRQSPPFVYERVLLPVDFSAASAASVRWAAAHLDEAHLMLAHAFELPYEGKLFYAGVDERTVEHYQEEARHALRQDLATFAQGAGLDLNLVSCKVVHGYAPGRLVELAASQQADLIVLPASSKTDTEQLFLGSVSLHVALESGCDVVVVRGQALRQATDGAACPPG